MPSRIAAHHEEGATSRHLGLIAGECDEFITIGAVFNLNDTVGLDGATGGRHLSGGHGLLDVLFRHLLIGELPEL